MAAETGRADFYFAKLCGLGVFQPFYIAGREAHDHFGPELNHDPPALAIVMRGNYSWNTSFQVLSTLVCQFEIVTQCHEFAPRPGTMFPGDPSRQPRVPNLPPRESIILPELCRSCRTAQIKYCLLEIGRASCRERGKFWWLSYP